MNNNEDLKKPVTKEYLGEFTEKVLLPGISVLIDEKLKPLDKKIDKIDERLQVVEAKLDRALYTEYIHLEARVKRLEEKVGIKPTA